MTKEELDEYFLKNYNTELPEEDQKRFDLWLKAESEKKGRDMSKDMYDYDLKGAFLDLLSNKTKQDDRGHFTDKYKKPNHPTFSDQSIYNNTESPFGFNFVGGKWEEKEDGTTSYTPSLEMLNSTHSLDFLIDYISKVEPNVKLELPKGAIDRNK